MVSVSRFESTLYQEPGSQEESTRLRQYRLRVCAALEHWIKRHFYDFEDPALLERLQDFVEVNIVAANMDQVICCQLSVLGELGVSASVRPQNSLALLSARKF